jgi:hypothetical protein
MAQAEAAAKKPPIQQMLVRAAASFSDDLRPDHFEQVYVPPHPLVKHWLAVLRNATTPNPMFRAACAELGRILIYEVC